MDWPNLHPWQREALARNGVYPPGEKPAPKPPPSTPHANRGMSWEHECEETLNHYQQTGRVATWWRCHPHVLITKDLGRGRVQGRRTSYGPPDAVIALTRGPVVLVDFKDCEGSRWALKNVADHQAARFTEWDNGWFRRAGVLLRFRGHRFYVPWKPLSKRWEAWRAEAGPGKRAGRGTASLLLAEIEDLAVPFEGAGWLHAVEES